MQQMATGTNNSFMYEGQGLEFNPQTDDWNTYIEQLEYFYEANNDSDDSKKRAILLSSCGTVTHKLFKGIAL